MLENLKWYLVQIGIKRYLPLGIMAAMTTLGTFLAAHAGILEQWGITYGTWPLHWAAGQDPSGSVILIELDTVSTATIAAIGMLIAVLMRATEHHVVGNSPPPPTAPPVGVI